MPLFEHPTLRLVARPRALVVMLAVAACALFAAASAVPWTFAAAPEIAAGRPQVAAAGAPLQVPSQAPTEAYRLVDTWASRRPNTGLPAFERPAGLDVAADNTIFVTDSKARKVFHLNDRGQLLTSWTPSDAVKTPMDVAVSANRTYVVGSPTDDAEIRDFQGTLLGTFQVDKPTGIAVGSDGRVYVARTMAVGSLNVVAIDVRDADGNLVTTWSGEPNFRIRNPAGIDVGADGAVYLAADGAVYIFRDGAVSGLLRVPAAIEGAPVTDVAVDGNRVFASLPDTVAGWVGGARADPPSVTVVGAVGVAVGPGPGLIISSYRTSGLAGLSYMENRNDLRSNVTFWGRDDDALGDLMAPSRIATTANGSVVIGDRLQRAQQWSSAGDPQAQWRSLTITDIAGGGNYGCITDGRRLACLGQAGAIAWEASPSPPGWLSSTDGNSTQLYTVDLASQVVWVVDRRGATVARWPITTGVGYAPIGDVAADEDALFLADRATNDVVMWDLAGQETGRIHVERGPVRLAAADGWLYVSTLDGYILKMARDGTLRGVIHPEVDITDIAAGPGGRVYVAVAPENHVLVYAPDDLGTPPPAPPPPPQDTCDVAVDKQAAPSTVRVGDRVTISLNVSGACPFGNQDLDIILVIDKSGSMLEPKMTTAKSAAITFLSEMNPVTTQVGLVAFSSDAEVAQPLTGNIRAVVGAVADLVIGGQTFYEEALDLARTEITGPSARAQAERVVIMLTDGQPTDRTRGIQAADRLKAEGVTLYVIGLGADIDHALMGSMASTPDLYFEAPTETELAGIYTAIARRIGATKLLRSAVVTDELPADMVFVPNSARPAPEINGRVLTWHLSDVPASGTTLTYQVRTSRQGHRPTNVAATIDYTDALSVAGQRVFPVPEVEVLPLLRAYLPTVFRSQCRPQRADLVLVMDTSSSMQEPARPGSSAKKIDEALQAARTFLDQVHLPDDHVAIVTFDGESRVVQELTGSRPALEFALAGVTTGSGTRIDRGIETGMREVVGPRHLRENTPVMVLMTDGIPSGGSEGATLTNATLAQQLGITLYTIGLGSNLDMLLLEIITGDPRRFYVAPDTAALAEIYTRIAGQALCK